VELHGQQAILSHKDARLGVRILAPADAAFDIVSANPKPPQGQQPNAKKLVARLPGKTNGARIAVLLWPYRANESAQPMDVDVKPLGKW